MTDFVVRYIAFNWWESNLNYLNNYTEQIENIFILLKSS